MDMDKKIPNNNTASVVGTFYQICVALERAFMLEEGEKLWIEKFGDVTVSGKEQLETKHYSESDSLTDGHSNFWNTLKNWLHPNFNQRDYKYLTLFTTQSIGSSSKLIEWNDATKSDRHSILQTILDESEKRHTESTASKTAGIKTSPPLSLVDQRFVLAASQSERLAEIIPKVFIASDSPRLLALRKKIINIYGKTILIAKSDDFLDDLIGYLISPSNVNNGWEISFAEFSLKLTEVSNRYRRGTVIFPMKNSIPMNVDMSQYEEKVFVKKLQEIEYSDVISDAVRHYILASLTVIQELREYEVDPNSYPIYAKNLKNTQQTRHKLAKRQLTGDRVDAAKNFYDQLTGEAPQPFPNFDQTPFEFRNGVFHMLSDDNSDNFEWKLW
jgi:hypothetical protein